MWVYHWITRGGGDGGGRVENATILIRNDKNGQITNEYIRGTSQVGWFGEKTKEARLRWYGHVRRKDDGYIGRRMLRWNCPRKSKRGTPKRRFMDAVREDMSVVEVTDEDAEDRTEWRWKIRCGDTRWEKPKEEENNFH